MRRRSGIGFGLFGALVLVMLAGCGGPKETDTKPEPVTAKPTTGGTEPAKGALKVGLVLDTGGPDDKSFNEAAVMGLKRAISELGLNAEKSKHIESKSAADYKDNLTNFATQNYDVVVAVGYKMEDALKEVAPQFPKVKFLIVDGTAPDAPNCAALNFREEEGCFLVGYLAAAVSKKKALGFVGGEEIPLIKKFEAGYRAGAKTADPTVQVKATYTGDWNDANKGKSQADQLFGNGVDIIMHAAGKAGLGVIGAAEAKGPGYYAIGVDQDQDGVAPGRVLTSMRKRLDNALFDAIRQIKEGQFDRGTHVYGVKEGGVGISELKFTKKDIPEAVLQKVETLRKMIADGKLTPPTTVEAVATFQPPKL